MILFYFFCCKNYIINEGIFRRLKNLWLLCLKCNVIIICRICDKYDTSEKLSFLQLLTKLSWQLLFQNVKNLENFFNCHNI